MRTPLIVLSPFLVLVAGGCPPPGNDGDGDATVDVTVLPSDESGSVTQSADGNTVTLTAVPSTGWLFDHWSEADISNPTTNPIEVDATEVDSITANFVEDTDADGDGVVDANDDCPDTAAGTSVDAAGCPIDVLPGDSDGDGVPNELDQCAATPPRANVDANGCAASQRDTDSDGLTDDEDACPTVPAETDDGCPADAVCGNGALEGDEQCDDGNTTDGDGCSAACQIEGAGAVCGNGVPEIGEQCDDGNTTGGDGCSATCQLEGSGAVCGNGVMEAGEQCDDGDTQSGDGCSASCQLEGAALPNDLCSRPTAVGDGTQIFTNVGATTDGPEEPADCTFFGRGDIPSDVWYCYTATCTGQATVSLCGSGYDTKMAVYAGCACPTSRPLDCSDDDCGTGVENTQSRVTFSAVTGQSYMIRIGGYIGDQGEGRLTITCGQPDVCANATGDCMTAHAESQPGCDTPSCCEQVCAVDQFCCDVTWDSFCASEAQGFCSTGFATCDTRGSSCGESHSPPGCNDVECCNTVCRSDPFCCVTTWDVNCVDRASLICTACGRGAGDCFAAHAAPGCDSVSCCGEVCTTDAFCCDTEWDATCAQTADSLCR